MQTNQYQTNQYKTNQTERVSQYTPSPLSQLQAISILIILQ